MISAKYGSWPSPVNAAIAVANLVGFGELRCADEKLYFLESRPNEGGRTVLCSLDLDGNAYEISPQELSARSAVHEYGGGAYCVSPTHAYLVNQTDQDVYEIGLEDGKCRNVTESGSKERFADLQYDTERARLVAVRESHSAGQEAVNDLAAIDIASGEVTVLHTGHDFYSSPRFSPDGTSLAFLVWDHPNMPFDGTQLYVGKVDEHGSLYQTTIVAGGTEESIVQPSWLSTEQLLFISDVTGYWNPHIYDQSGTFCVVQEEAEYAGPHWMFGTSSYTALNDAFFVASRSRNDYDDLVFIDCKSQLLSPFDDEYESYGSIVSVGDGVAFIAGKADDMGAIVFKKTDGSEVKILRKQGELAIDASYISSAKPIQYENGNGEKVHAFFYEPTNPGVEKDPADRPPLLVLSHGGPTGHSGCSLSYQIQFYTTRGWAVLDVNYGGSSGYGRAYRQRLAGNWGIVDVEDCEAGVRHLIARGLIDPNHVAIKGGSAGGYTTLCGLSQSDIFKAGSSLYGVADVEALVRDTHKFESRYIDGLIPADQIHARSPIHRLDKFNNPVIFFQGSEDRVVPPEQSQAMFDALKQKGIPTALVIYEGEKHGFRDGNNIRRTMEAEFVFLSQVFGLEPSDVDVNALNAAELANWK